MAYISSSDESNTPPREFHLSSCSLSEGRMSPVKHKCPLCRKLSEVFYCRQCIYSGSYQSTSQPADGFEKKLALLELRKNVEQLKAHVEQLQKHLLKRSELSSNIKQTKQDIETIKSSLVEKEWRKRFNDDRSSALRKYNEDWRGKLILYEKKLKEIENYVSVHKEEVEGRRRTLEEKRKLMKTVVRFHIQELFRVMFPITTIEPVDDLSHPIDEAHTTVINNYWEYSDYFSEKKLRIVAPTLPSSGNYSAYNDWVAKNKEVASSNSVESVEMNPAFTISAGLFYTAQLVYMLSYFLDFRLPCKMIYGDFLACYMDKEQFERKVARLNANILHLCVVQNVNSSKLSPARTLDNIRLLIEDERCDLGRYGPREYNYHQLRKLEKPLLGKLLPGEESDSEDNDPLTADWEAVPRVQCPEMAAGPAVAPTTPPPIPVAQQASILVNNAAASLASLWRGFTGR